MNALCRSTPAFMTAQHPLLEADPYFEPGHAATELSLRNQVLTVFAELPLKPHNGTLAQTLARYWQELGLAAADLTLAIDIAMRDGYLAEQHEGEAHFPDLTDAGRAYAGGTPTPRALAVLAPHVATLSPAVPLSLLDQLTLGLFHAHEEQDFVTLRHGWRATGLDLNALLHGLDRLYKQHRIELTDDDPLSFRRC